MDNPQGPSALFSNGEWWKLKNTQEYPIEDEDDTPRGQWKGSKGLRQTYWYRIRKRVENAVMRCIVTPQVGELLYHKNLSVNYRKKGELDHPWKLQNRHRMILQASHVTSIRTEHDTRNLNPSGKQEKTRKTGEEKRIKARHSEGTLPAHDLVLNKWYINKCD